MDGWVIQFRVGVMVLATLIISVILILLFEELPLRHFLEKPYTVYVKFPESRGISDGTPVYKNGIRIGEVKQVDLADNDTAVLVTIEIQEERRIYENEKCHIVSDLLGDTSLSFRRLRDPEASQAPIEPEATLHGAVIEDPTGLKAVLKEPIDTVTNTGIALEKAGNELGRAASKLSNFLDQNSDKIAEALTKATDTLDSVGKAAENANQLFGDPETQEQLKVALKNLPDTLDQFRLTMKKAQTNLDNLEKFTGTLGEGSEERVRRVNHAIVQMDELLTELNTFSQALNDENSSLGRLIKDPQLYNDLAAAAENVKKASQRLRPIVEDVRIFTDKIARHPGILVRDAVRPGAGIK